MGQQGEPFDKKSFQIVATDNPGVSITLPAMVGNGVVQGQSVITTIPHNLGYEPAMLLFMDSGGSNAPIASGSLVPGGELVAGLNYSGCVTWSLFVDDTNLYIRTVQNVYGTVGTPISGFTGHFGIRYYLLREVAG